MVTHHAPVDFLSRRQVEVGVGLPLIRECRSAGSARHLDRMQDRAARRNIEVRIIGVEVRACVDQADRLSVAMNVGQNQDIRVDRMVKAVDHMRLGISEATRERDELLRGQRLSGDHDEAVLVQSAFNRAECRIIQRLRKVDAGYTGAENFRDRLDRWRHVLMGDSVAS